MADFHFIRPLWLLALLPAALLWLQVWRQSHSLGPLAKAVDPALLKHLLIDARSRQRIRPIHLLGTAWLFATLALAGPSWKQMPMPFADEQAGLLVILRVSPTMQASDVPPTRLQRARHKLSDLLDARRGTATGLIAYDGSAHLVVPLSRDERILNTMAESLRPDIMPRQGDALAEALALAHNTFKRANMAGSILVITDHISQSDHLQSSLPVQFWSMQSLDGTVPPSIRQAAKTLRAPLTALRIDRSDVDTIARRAQSNFANVSHTAHTDHWQDAGYALLPILALVFVLHFRKGWRA